jgi:hypothetical protein
MKSFDVFVTYDLRPSRPQRSQRVKKGLEKRGWSSTLKGAAANGNDVGLPFNTLHIKIPGKDGVMVIQQASDIVKYVFEVEKASGPFFISVPGSGGGWAKGYVPASPV